MIKDHPYVLDTILPLFLFVLHFSVFFFFLIREKIIKLFFTALVKFKEQDVLKVYIVDSSGFIYVKEQKLVIVEMK